MRVQANYQGSSSEVFDLSAYEKTSFSAKDFDELKQDYQNVSGILETSVNGRNAVVFSASNASLIEGEESYYIIALIDCPSYVISFTGVIPDELS